MRRLGRKQLHLAGLSGAVALLACEGSPGDDRLSLRADSIVYDGDDRKEVYEVGSPLRDVAALSVAAVVSKAVIANRTSAGTVELLAPTLMDADGLCSDERFADEPAAAFCSAVLLDTNLVLTAGHCVAGAHSCADLGFVFDFYYRATGRLERIESADVFGCRRVIVQETGDADFALVELDRAAYGRKPLDVGELGDAPALAVIGTPSGLPLKVELGAKVLDPQYSAARFTLASDTFEGSSGSAVLTTEGKLVGIAARGAADYEGTDAGCVRTRRASAIMPVGGGEQGIHLQPILSALCEAGWSNPKLCAVPCASDCADAGESGPVAEEAADATPADSHENGEDADAGEALASPRRRSDCAVTIQGASACQTAWIGALMALAYRRAGVRRRVLDSARRVCSR